MIPPLPIPHLNDSIARFLSAFKVVTSAASYQQAQQAAAHFAATKGAQLQNQLIEYAASLPPTQSWVSEFWQQSYLQGRDVKAHSSNVGFALDFVTPLTGIAKAADLIQRLAQLHHDFCANNLPVPQDARGAPLTMTNWQVLSGAMRQPHPQQDQLYYADIGTQNRHCSVFYRGNHWLLRLSDANGQLCGSGDILAALGHLSAGAPSLDFCLPSALPSAEAATVLTTLCQNPRNQQHYQACCDSWFAIALFDGEGADDITLLRQQSFLPNRGWQYKPFSYQLDLCGDFVAVNVEHSGIDGANLQQMLARVWAQTATATGAPSELTPANWQLDADLAAQIRQQVQNANQHADQYQICRFGVDSSALTGKISHDALVQFSLAYAQLAVFAQLRNTYEAVDTSHFAAGRTECLRANTPSAKALVQAMLAKSPRETLCALLPTALAAHREWVIACKKGQGCDRHLFALGMLDQWQQPFFEYVRRFLGADFLSTSSVGSQSPIRRFVFAPTSVGGFGVNYSFAAGGYEYCLIANHHSPELAPFAAGVQAGAKALIALGASG